MSGPEPDDYDKLLAILKRVRQQAIGARQEDFALTGRCRPEPQRVAYLFGKAYWWDRGPDGRLTLQPALWLRPPAQPAR